MPIGGREMPRKWDNAIWRLLLFAKKFQFNSIHNAQDTPIKFAELVCYSDSDSDLRRMTDFVRRNDKHYDILIFVKHDMGKAVPRNCYPIRFSTSTVAHAGTTLQWNNLLSGIA